MSDCPPVEHESVPVRASLWIVIIGSWTLVVGILCTYAIIQSKAQITENANLEAKTNIDKDLAYRRWVADQGGIYVPPTEQTPPNPYLHLPSRDIVTRDGKTLTLVNPAYMTRLVQESSAQLYGIKGHLTSLNPTRPDNKPDPWEASALKKLEKGAAEVADIVDIDGSPYLRTMRAFVTENQCLKCHADQGYSIGDIRGGISVSVPLEHYYALYRSDRNGTLFRYAIIWILGTAAILVLRASLKRSSASLQASEKRFRTLIEQAPEAIVVVEANLDRIVNANPAAERLFGCGRDELLQTGLQRFYVNNRADDQPMTEEEEVTHRRILAGEVVKTERRIHTVDGRELVCELHIVLLPAEQSKLIRICFFDITERLNAERKIEEIAKRLELATSSAKLGIWDWDIKNNTMLWDDQMLALYGYTRETFPGAVEAWKNRLHPDDRESAREAWQAVLRGDSALDHRFRIVRPTGEIL